jgi:[ribosomal protein S18]-alanine N-acetyltransferase
VCSNRELKKARILIRRMTTHDLNPVMEIEGRSFPSPWSRGLFERELTIAFSRVFVACEAPGGDVLGYVCLWLVTGEAHILNLAVHPDRRGEGIGSLILSYAMDDCRRNGVQEITLEVRRSNYPAISLYRSFEFLPMGIRPRYYRDNGEDAILMARDLTQPAATSL